MSKNLFLQMREQEIITDNFLPTKKEIQKSSKEFALKIIDEGTQNIYELFAQSIRLQESLNVINSELKSKLPEDSFESFGIKGIFRNGGAVLNYHEDEIYNKLKADLDARVELLKLAQKQEVLDLYGNEVPKVSLNPRKSSLAISF